MNNPIQIMAEIERLNGPSATECTVPPGEWVALREAVEAQQDRMAYQDQKHTECAENLVAAQARIGELEIELAQAEQEVENVREWFNAYQSIDSWLFGQLNGEFVVEHDKPDGNTIASIKRLLAHKDARIARLEEAIDEPRPKAFTDWLSLLNHVLNESPAQSAAALKAEALRDFRLSVSSQMTGEGITSKLDDAIARIEREAEGGE